MKTENINWSGWIYAGRVRLGWSGDNYDGCYNAQPANLAEIDGQIYAVRRGTVNHRIICQFPADDPNWPDQYATLTPDGQSVQVVCDLKNAAWSWADILKPGTTVVIA